ncbi:MAG: hypothetical protein WAV51_01495 [Microgenomates group bacterium]
MSPEIPYQAIQQKLVEFIHTSPLKGVNTLLLEGAQHALVHVDAVAGYFPEKEYSNIPIFFITTASPDDPPFEYLTDIANLRVPDAFTAQNYLNETDQQKFTAHCILNGQPTVAVLFGHERDPKDNHITNKKVSQLYFIQGANPQEELGKLQTLVQARRKMNN